METTIEQTTKTITLRTGTWGLIERAVKAYNDEGSQRSETWCSAELQSAKMRFLIALEDAPEVKEGT